MLGGAVIEKARLTQYVRRGWYEKDLFTENARRDWLHLGRADKNKLFSLTILDNMLDNVETKTSFRWKCLHKELVFLKMLREPSTFPMPKYDKERNFFSGV